MRVVVFGVTMSSSWGNSHASLWRGLCRGLAELGHTTTFFECDAPEDAAHRDLGPLSGTTLELYREWDAVVGSAKRALSNADIGIVTSCCPNAVSAAHILLDSNVAVRLFYDLDAPLTLARLRRPAGHATAEWTTLAHYLPPEGLGGFDAVLSLTGGIALALLVERLGARRVFPLYGGADPAVHGPPPARTELRADLSYLGTYAPDRQAALSELFLEPASRRPDMKFLLGGSMYPGDIPWPSNIRHVEHVVPRDHAAFFCSSRLTLNVTRGPLASMGYCPSVRLFEAAASGAPIVSDPFRGLERFFAPGREILTARDAEEALLALSLSDAELSRLSKAARERTLDEHTLLHRARELVRIAETLGAD